MIVRTKRQISVTQAEGLFIIAIISLIISSIASVCIGRYPITISELMTEVINPSIEASPISTVIYNVRMPRIIGALLAGGVLSIAGGAYQGIFRNPMVSPDILGVSSGAAFGASIGILLSFGIFGVQVMAFVFGLGAVGLSYGISRVLARSNDSILMLVLSGMVISSLFGALISLIKYVADQDSQLPAITFWMMGSLNHITFQELRYMLPIIVVGLIPLFLISWKLNVLSFGEEEARSLGIDTNILRVIVIVCSSLITATVVSMVGLIGWVGLIVPHFGRFLIGPDNKKLLPFAFLLGSIFMLWVDNISRTLTALEVPIGIITSIIGAPLFLFFLAKTTGNRF